MSKNAVDIQNHTKIKRRVRGLIITYYCNLSCTYCYIPDKSFTPSPLSCSDLQSATETCDVNSCSAGKIMPVKIAQTAIEDIFKKENSEGYDEIEIDFVGAEPLTVFNNIKIISEWFWNKEWPKPSIFFATTNGTLLNQEMKEWFYQNRERFVLGLSYDGDTYTQNINRSGSALSVDLEFFFNTWPAQPVKMTISEKTVGRLADNIIYLHEKGVRVSANPANGMKAWKKSNITEYGKQLLRLMNYYLSNPSVPPSTLFTVGLAGVLDSFARPGSKYCGAGEGYDVIDVDGKKYPCHMFSPLVLPESKLELLHTVDFCSPEYFEDIMCKDCILKKICPSCYGLNFKQHGNPAIREITLCKLFKIQALANCKFYLHKLSQKEQLSSQEQQIIQGVKMIYDYFYKKQENRPRASLQNA